MLWISLDKDGDIPLTRQIYQQIRFKILGGEMNTKEKLPSSRELASSLQVSRNTVLNAYDQLASDGYLEIVPNSGIYVAAGTFLGKKMEPIRDYTITSLSDIPIAQGKISFDSGVPAVEFFPRKKWLSALEQAYNEAPPSILGYDYPQGRIELRNTLVKYLRKVRGINCSPDQIIITSGAKQGLSLIGKCLLNSEKEVWIEDPTNLNVLKIFSYHTRLINPVPTDEEGIRTDLFPDSGYPALIFVTPAHQFPRGGILSIQRRIELIRFAQSTGAYIVEDDYDSEFRYEGPPVCSLQELDRDRVIYVGTFSKIMFPSLRLGYLVLPCSLVNEFKEWKRLGDHHSNSLNQLALVKFIENRNLEKHINRMKRIYCKRRDYLLECLEKYFPDQIEIIGKSAGMHLIVKFKNVDFVPSLLEKIEREGLSLISVEQLAITKGIYTKELLMGYAHLREEEILEGVLKLKALVPIYNFHHRA